MSSDKTGGPAFPQLTYEDGERDGHGDLIEPFTTAKGGMTLRQWYSGLAMQGMLAHGGFYRGNGSDVRENSGLAAEAFKIAEAMVAHEAENG